MNYAAWICLSSWGLVAAVACAADRLDEQLEKRGESPAYRQAEWGVLVVDLKSGELLHQRNPDHLFAPASTTKLFSVAAAWDEFGPDYRFSTPIYAHGKVNDQGELDGDLILVASGDPTMGGRTRQSEHISFTNEDHTYANFRDIAELTPEDPLAGLRELARGVAASGIRRVRGEVVVDDRMFEHDTSTGSGPARLTPIVVNDNVIDIIISPAAAGKPATVDWRPKMATIAVDAAVETVAADGELRVRIEDVGSDRLVVRGRIPAGRRPLVRIHEVSDPASFARSLLIDALRESGVAVQASPLSSNPHDLLPAEVKGDSFRQVAVLTSPRFAESARLVLKVSHNLHASMLPLLVATRHGKRTVAAGLRLQRDFLARAGVAPETISFGGGAGGSTSDLVTPRSAVALLRYLATRPDFAAFRDALPVLGVDGTLATTVDAASPVKGHAQGKTGTYVLPNVLNGGFVLTSKALAGYLTTSSGRDLAFAFYVNNVHLRSVSETADVGRELGKLCELLYSE